MRPSYFVIVLSPDPETAAVLREWLRSERRLGIAHCAVDSSAASAAPARESGRPTGAPAAAARGSSGSRGGDAPATASDHRSGGTRAERSVLAQSLPVRTPTPHSAALSLGLPADEAFGPPCGQELAEGEAATALAALDAAHVRGCQRCGLHAGRKQTVFGVGRVRPEVVFVGEGPGADEDVQGEPFVGRAGQLLTRMISAMTLSREQVYICNVVKCRPPGNRTPTDEEMQACAPFLWRQLAVLRPKVIVALGRPASQTLLATKLPIGQLRGQMRDFPPPELQHLGLPACKLMPTFHPAYLLRSPNEKAKAWDDLKAVMSYLGLRVPGPG